MGQLVETFIKRVFISRTRVRDARTKYIFMAALSKLHLHQLAFHFVLNLLDLGRLGAATPLQSRFHCIGDSRSLQKRRPPGCPWLKMAEAIFPSSSKTRVHRA